VKKTQQKTGVVDIFCVVRTADCASSGLLTTHKPLNRSPVGRRTVLARAAAPKKQKMMWEALREATDEEMEKDPTVCVIGESFYLRLEILLPFYPHDPTVQLICPPLPT
jgi:hypothetical protein